MGIIGSDETSTAPCDGHRKIGAQLGEIVLGRKAGGHTQNDIILVNPFGLAIEDVALAMQVYQTAQKLEPGMWLER